MAQRPMARELIVGASVDGVFGPVVLFGEGGTAVEVLADRAIALPPLNRVLARELVSRTRVARLLAGYRDHPPVKLDAVCDALIGVSQMLADLPGLCELDINPLWADHEGVLALDARIRVSREAVAGAERFAIAPYPAHLAREVAWQGGTITVRPIRPEDEARLTQIDYSREMAFIATRPLPQGGDETLAVVRAVIDPDNVDAEFAIIVRSDLKGHGLGMLMMRRLIEHLESLGTRRLVGFVLRENDTMRELADVLGFAIRVGESNGDTLCYVLELKRQR